MKIKVCNPVFDDTTTISEMWLDDKFECFVLEPTYRGDDNSNHVQFKTAISSGLYKVIIDKSLRFDRYMPHILSIKDYPFGIITLNSAGVRQHWGNWAKDTEACQILGTTKGIDFVGHSVDEFNIYFNKLQNALSTGDVFMEIIRTPRNS